MQRTNKIWNRINLIAVCVIACVTIIGIIFAFAPKVAKKNNYQKIYEENKAKTEQLKKAEEQIKININRIKQDPSFAEQIAHEKGYAREDETIFYFPEDKKDNEL